MEVYLLACCRVIFKKKREDFSEVGRKVDAKPKPKKPAKVPPFAFT